MPHEKLASGQMVFDPQGVVQRQAKAIHPRLACLDGLRLGILDNTKWNGGRLLRKTLALLEAEHTFQEVRFYQKESFSKNASPELVAQIVQENDLVLTAIGD